MAKAAGPLGTNAAYVASLEAALAELGTPDAYVSALARAIEASA